MDKEFLKIILEDIEYITEVWNLNEVNDRELRISSNILRRLLIEGNLIKASKLLNFKKIRILSSNDEFPNTKNPAFHLSGGVKHKGMKLYSTTFYNRALSADEIKKNYDLSQKKSEKLISLTEFLKKPSITIFDTKINREEVIKYVCNKLGGAHYDPKRNLKKNIELKYKILDNLKDTIKIADKNPVYLELLSIGQRIVNSKDVLKLKKKLKYILST